jgi:hypothetical protein
VQPDDLHAGPAAHAQAHLAGVGNGDAELVALQAGRDVRVALRVDVGIDAHGHARLDAASHGDRVDRSISPSDSALMLRSPRPMARSSSASVLPTPVKTISAGVKPARKATSISPTEFASAAAPRLRSRRAIPSVELALRA